MTGTPYVSSSQRVHPSSTDGCHGLYVATFGMRGSFRPRRITSFVSGLISVTRVVAAAGMVVRSTRTPICIGRVQPATS